MRYRIVSNGYDYKIQKRGFLCGWKDLKVLGTRTNCFFTPTYGSIEAAKYVLKDLIDDDKRKSAKYKEVE